MEELAYFDCNGELLEIVDEKARQNIRTLHEFQDIVETTSSTLQNSYAGRLLIDEIGGVMEQDSTAGKNIFNIKTLTPRSDTQGGTVSFDKDVANVSSANQSWATLFSDDISVEIGKSYILKIKVSNYSATTEVILAISNSEGVRYSQKYITANGYYEIVFAATTNAAKVQVVANNNNSQVTNTFTISEAQLEEGTVATTYEPFTNGASPNPSYPQEIRKSVISEIRTIWKNLANLQNDGNKDKGSYTYTTLTAEKVIATKNASGGCFVARYVANLKAGTTYHVSLTENSYQVYFYYDELWGSVWKTFSSNDITITPSKDGTYVIGIYVSSAVTSGSEVTVSNFMIEEGTEATEYEPYTESVITLSEPIDLYGKDGVQDVLTTKRIGRKYAKIVLSGDRIASSSKYEATNTTRFVIAVADNPSVANAEVMCNIASRAISGSNVNTCRVYSATQIFLFLDADSFPDKASLVSYLENNEVYFIYELAEETTEELPIADQIALNSLQMFDGITYVEFVSDVQPTYKAEYGTSKVGGVALEAYADTIIDSFKIDEATVKANEANSKADSTIGAFGEIMSSGTILENRIMDDDVRIKTMFVEPERHVPSDYPFGSDPETEEAFVIYLADKTSKKQVVFAKSYASNYIYERFIYDDFFIGDWKNTIKELETSITSLLYMLNGDEMTLSEHGLTFSFLKIERMVTLQINGTLDYAITEENKVMTFRNNLPEVFRPIATVHAGCMSITSKDSSGNRITNMFDVGVGASGTIQIQVELKDNQGNSIYTSDTGMPLNMSMSWITAL